MKVIYTLKKTVFDCIVYTLVLVYMKNGNTKEGGTLNIQDNNAHIYYKYVNLVCYVWYFFFAQQLY